MPYLNETYTDENVVLPSYLFGNTKFEFVSSPTNNAKESDVSYAIRQGIELLYNANYKKGELIQVDLIFHYQIN